MRWEITMTDFQILSAIRGHLNRHAVAQNVHLTIPPKAGYPLVLIELEELWCPFPFGGNEQRNEIHARIKFKVSIYSRLPGVEEAASISHNVRTVLEGATIMIEADKGNDMLSTVRFLACVVENAVNSNYGDNTRTIHQFYDCILRR
jgi:hypothetical protein